VATLICVPSGLIESGAIGAALPNATVDPGQKPAPRTVTSVPGWSDWGVRTDIGLNEPTLAGTRFTVTVAVGSVNGPLAGESSTWNEPAEVVLALRLTVSDCSFWPLMSKSPGFWSEACPARSS
jgi:hypothetical protein